MSSTEELQVAQATQEDAVVSTEKAVEPVKKLKPARKQVKPGEIERKMTPQTGKEYNIWYNKWAGGDREDSYSNKTKAQTRCNIRKDSGVTRADRNGIKYCCLFFARGCCPYGWECEYLHRLPNQTTALPDTSKDCFARDKFSDYRDDMGGVGSFTRMNRTLYVGRIKETGEGDHTEEVVRRHFGMWGEIERNETDFWIVRVLQYRSVAFVTYVSELNAQFAKEAMACQSLDNDEILNVRWATEDPNPVQKVAEKRRLEEVGREAIQGKIDTRIVDAVRHIRALEDGEELPDEYEIETEQQPAQEDDEDEEPGAKRRKIEAPPVEEPPQAKGILSADTIEGLKYFAQIRARNGGAPVTVKAVPVNRPAGTLALADYGSDSDEE
ncbi:hypothetical protein SISNIDRAFT_442445 [Sistotremastrum niveocremeum HHB9708]|uniref:Pre-mRNA-splicing factor CWC2 n=2 Tax=Sistotremastraceae TaxID=3402574 RepID=A0A164TQH2_9AGAM|nr:hypothetical protein SISNIDRAFT_442445 [Sistotremastrum niveocremeum HHB9708]KZT42223.1 hypothetical protein SISSUDRAFT_1016373 [Sistotremastrum suecicum HHB10207 ss-3]